MLHLLPVGRGRAHLSTVSARSLSLVGPPSFALRARPEDHGAMWPAIATRCRRRLPARLQWAPPLLDPQQPVPVLCAEAQVNELYRWLGGLPNPERVSVGCRRGALLGTAQRG